MNPALSTLPALPGADDDDAFFDDYTPLHGDGSLVIGAVPMYFHYNGFTWFNNTGYMAILGSPKNNILIAYGENDDLLLDSSLKTVRVNIQVGGNATLWDRFLRLPLEIFIPIQLNMGYQYLSPDISEMDMGSEYGFSDDSMNFLNVNLGAGLGATFTMPLESIPLLGTHLSIDSYFVRSPGVMVHLVSDDSSPWGQANRDNEVGIAVSNDFLLQARLHRFLESNIGLSAGVRFSGLNWSTDDFNFADLMSAFTGDDVPDNRMDYTTFFIGLNW
ncbi:hypothetical protein QA596_04350 [Balneolales bacterium ANBcel1]|nr:hypothetical protein [Balneolales bacterium ANBcel1]